MNKETSSPAAVGAGIAALRRLAEVLDHKAAAVVLNIADLLDQARGDGERDMAVGDQMLADHIDQAISELWPQPAAIDPAGGFSADFMAEQGLAALKDSHRDAAWIARSALDHAMRLCLSARYSEAMELANRAILVRDAIAQRIAILEPDVGKVVAAHLRAGQGGTQRTTH